MEKSKKKLDFILSIYVYITYCFPEQTLYNESFFMVYCC